MPKTVQTLELVVYGRLLAMLETEVGELQSMLDAEYLHVTHAGTVHSMSTTAILVVFRHVGYRESKN
jgi:hypothetical protein